MHAEYSTDRAARIAAELSKLSVEELLTLGADCALTADRLMHEVAQQLPESYRYKADMPDGSRLLHPYALGWQLAETARRWGQHIAEQTELRQRDGHVVQLRPIPEVRPLATKLRRLDDDATLDEVLAGAYGPDSGGAA